MHKRKNCLIMDRERYRYQQFISDISGQDIAAHHNDMNALIATVRDWLSTASGGGPLPGGTAIARRFAAFDKDVPSLCEMLRLQVSELTFGDYVNCLADGASDPIAELAHGR